MKYNFFILIDHLFKNNCVTLVNKLINISKMSFKMINYIFKNYYVKHINKKCTNKYYNMYKMSFKISKKSKYVKLLCKSNFFNALTYRTGGVRPWDTSHQGAEA